MLAEAALLGLDVELMMNGNSFERSIRERLVIRGRAVRERHDDNLAAAVVKHLSIALENGR